MITLFFVELKNIISRTLNEIAIQQTKKTKRQTTVYKLKHRKIKTDPYDPHKKWSQSQIL